MNKWLLALLAFAVSALQAWDSGALGSEGFVRLLIAVAVVLPPVVIVGTVHPGTRLAACGAAIALFATARLVSDAHLPELVLAGVFPGILVFAAQLRSGGTSPAGSQSGGN